MLMVRIRPGPVGPAWSKESLQIGLKFARHKVSLAYASQQVTISRPQLPSSLMTGLSTP